MKKLFQKHTFLLLAVLLPVLAMADDEKINLNKYVTENADGTYTLDLETYATGYTKQTSSFVATDFVLVLDRSGSMTNNYMRGDRVETGSTLDSSKKYMVVKSDGRTYNLWWMGTGTGTSSRTRNKWHTSFMQYYLDDVTYDPTDYEYYGGEVFSTTKAYVVKPTDEIYETLSLTRMDALKIAVKNFLDAVYENNPTEGQKHRVATVWYAGTSSGTPYGRVSDYLGNCSKSTSTSYDLKELVGSSAGTGQETLAKYKAQIDKVEKTWPASTADGLGLGTITALGMRVAYNTLMSAKNDGRNKVVIFFTDGEPGTSGGKFYVPDAREACQWAADIKMSSDLENTVTGQSGQSKTFGPVVYSIGVMDDATALYQAYSSLDEEKTANANDKYQFMHYISSNYLINRASFSSYNFDGSLTPTCQGATDDGTACTGHGSEDPHGYFMRCDGADLSSAFAKIAEKETKDRDDRLDGSSTVVIDDVSTNFRFPDGFDATSIKMYTCDANTSNKTTDVVWNTTGTGGITIYKDAAGKRVASSVTGGHVEYWVPLATPTTSFSDSDKEIELTDYDFKDNFVGPVRDFTDNDNYNIIGWTGQKLIVEFDIERDPSTPGRDNEMETNTAESGVYVNNSLLASYPIPTVPVPNIIIAKKGLKAGESAVFEVVRVTDATGGTADAVNTFQHTVVLTASSSNPNPTVEFVASGPGYYKVTEKSWTWNYVTTYDSNADGTPETDGASYVQQIASTDTDKTFTFGIKSGSKKTGVRVEFYDEKGVNNNFK